MSGQPASSEPSMTSRLSILVNQLREGDEAAFGVLLSHLEVRLHNLARRMLRGFPSVRGREQTDDVLQSAMIRLHQALRSVKPTDMEHFIRLAALQIRRELLLLARRHAMPIEHGLERLERDTGRQANPPGQNTESTWDPSDLARWTEFHEKVETLEDAHRQVFDLLFYQGLAQGEAALILGVSERTVRTRWREARFELIEKMDGHLPGS